MNRQVTILPGLDPGGDDDSTIEQKFLFQPAAKDLLLDWLEFRFVRDPEHYHGPIISLYYDTPALRFFDEVRNGDYLKTKVRLRWYQTVFPPEQALADCFLEIKQKFGVRRYKRRQSLALEPSCLKGDLFTHPAIRAVPENMSRLILLARGIIVPVLIVEYERFRFIDPRTGSRIALDSGITCSRANSAYLSGMTPVTLPVGVVEVKGALDTLPDGLRPMQRHLRKQSFSKYARCCELLIGPSLIRRAV
jgi:hypothetical protein